MSTDRVIVLKGNPPQFEGKAAEAITPGMLLEFNTSGDLIKHDSAGGNLAAMFAIENSLQGDEVGDAYASGARVQYVHARPGDEIQAYLYDGESVSINDFLESAGNGYLRKAHDTESDDIYNNNIVGVALETLDLSSALGTTRIRIRVV